MNLPHEFTSTGSRGAASEMIACAYLLRRGFHVFRSVSQSCPFDGMAYRDGESLRFEVKSVALEFRGAGACAFTWPKNDEWDLLLIVTLEGEVHEFLAPTTYEQVRDALRSKHGLPPVSDPKPPVPRRPPQVIECGTWRGFLKHRRDKTEACEPCEQARVVFSAEAKERAERRWGKAVRP